MASIEFGADLAHMMLKGEYQKNYMKKKSMNTEYLPHVGHVFRYADFSISILLWKTTLLLTVQVQDNFECFVWPEQKLIKLYFFLLLFYKQMCWITFFCSTPKNCSFEKTICYVICLTTILFRIFAKTVHLVFAKVAVKLKKLYWQNKVFLFAAFVWLSLSMSSMVSRTTTSRR